MSSMYGKQGVRLPRLQHVSQPIPAGSQDAIRAFYGDLLGFEEKLVPQTLRDSQLVWFVGGDNGIELHFVPDTYLAHKNEQRHICLEVDDLEHCRKILQAAGYPIKEATPIPSRPRFFTSDPAGNHLEFTTIQDDYLQSPTTKSEE